MAESEVHLDLVRLILEHARRRFETHRGVAIYSDLPTSTNQTRPSRINGFVPDVFITDVPTTWMFIGEAKTTADLLLPHSIAQLRAFLDVLQYHRGVLMLAVPWSSEVTARQLVESIMKRDGITGVETGILPGPSTWR